MNFEFHIMAHGFEKAAKLEAELKKLGIPYDVKMAKAVCNKSTRTFVTPAVLQTVLRAVEANPRRSDKELARETGVGHNTVNRIRNGKHALQQGVKA